jgi:tetratricopeptide (TPR) repeat protein
MLISFFLLATTSCAGWAEEYKIDDNAAGGYLNIRNGPGVGHSIVGHIPAGTNGVEVKTCQSPDDDGRSTKLWCQVEWSGLSGWASSCCMAPVNEDDGTYSSGFLNPQSIEIDNGADATTATDCDRLAARPMMGDTPSEISGIALERIETKSAIAACSRAIANQPKTARFVFELGRAFDAAQDYSSALAYYKKAAAAGERAAMTNLGYLYQYGLGVTANDDAARVLYEQAAGLGDPPAMTDIGYMYESGAGVPRDYAQAVLWYEKAANGGEINAILDLARLYEQGEGVPQDYSRARAWFGKAVGLGYTAAADDLNRLSKEEARNSSSKEHSANSSAVPAEDANQTADAGDGSSAGGDESVDGGSDNQADDNSGDGGDTDQESRGMCTPNRIGPEASRSDPVPSDADGTWSIICDEDGSATLRTYYGGDQDESASIVEDNCGSSNVMVELGGCPGEGGNVGIAWPRSMTLLEASEAKQVWMACPSGDPASGNYLASLRGAADQAKNICTIKSGCECRSP